jgi:hypothetical protein
MVALRRGGVLAEFGDVAKGGECRRHPDGRAALVVEGERQTVGVFGLVEPVAAAQRQAFRVVRECEHGYVLLLLGPCQRLSLPGIRLLEPVLATLSVIVTALVDDP